jgi:hypothetical protein
VKVAWLLNDLQLSGGVGVVVEHARRLQHDHGFESVLVLAQEQDEPDWQYRGLTDVRVETMVGARAEKFDIAVATWWETAFSLFELNAARYAHFVQSLEDRFYLDDEPERTGAVLTLDFPVAFITEARWIADTLGRARPDAQVFYVRNGVDKAAFPLPEQVEPRMNGPLRVMVEGYVQSWFKNVSAASYATGAMKQPHHLTLVVPDREALPEDIPADEIVGPIPQAEMSELYARTDVVLKMSSVEGMFGPPLEGFHRGATTVVTPVTGHDEYVQHGWNGLVSEWDDLRGTARQLDLLAKDRRMLHFLRTNAVETARAWPSTAQSSQFMAAALRRIATLPPPQVNGRRLAGDVRAVMDVHRKILGQRDAISEELAPVWKVRSHPVYQRLKRFRHTRIGRAITWPARVVLRPVYRRITGG